VCVVWLGCCGDPLPIFVFFPDRFTLVVVCGVDVVSSGDIRLFEWFCGICGVSFGVGIVNPEGSVLSCVVSVLVD